MTGFIGTFVILLGYVAMALKKNPAIIFTLGSVVWSYHAFLMQDNWLLVCNLLTTMLGIISVIRAKVDSREKAVA